MELGTVTGSVWATRKEPGLQGLTLLLIETHRGQTVAADRLGAGLGDRVLVAYGGAARGEVDLPIDAAVVAIVDSSQ